MTCQILYPVLPARFAIVSFYIYNKDFRQSNLLEEHINFCLG